MSACVQRLQTQIGMYEKLLRFWTMVFVKKYKIDGVLHMQR